MEIEMIIGNPYKVAIQLEQVDFLCSPSGMFNVIINDSFIPGKGVTIDLYVVISSLKESFNYGLENITSEIGNTPIEEIDFSEGEPAGLIYLNFAELHDYGCNFWLGFNGGEERLIYSLDYESTFSEVRFSRGTIESLIRKIPNAEELSVDKNNEIIITRKH